MVEWFRQDSWSPEQEEAFFARLNRSRSVSHKAQCLRIQAYHLAETRDVGLVTVAISLLDRLLQEFPEPTELTQAFDQRARCFQFLGETAKAVADFRSALEAEERYPGVKSNASLGLAWLIAVEKIDSLYDLALSLVDKKRGTLRFHFQDFECSVVRALIAQERGQHAEASDHARQALEAALRTESGLRYHRIVGDQHAAMVERMRLLSVRDRESKE